MDKQKFRGVREKYPGKFQAYHSKDGNWNHLGYFSRFEDAKAARIAYEVREYGYEFDKRKPFIDGPIGQIPLHGRDGAFHGYAVVDAADFDLVASIPWSLGPAGYAAGYSPSAGYSVLMHRFLMVDGERHGPDVDHMNNDRLDNRRSNLRLCSRQENCLNRSPIKGRSTPKGVTPLPSGNYQARISVGGKTTSLGSFATIKEAAQAYDAAAVRLHGEFAHTNARALARKAA